MQVAAYIRNLGYEAVPSMTDTALVIPYALKAGLGEYARNQMVITAEFGPRLRFSKIFTSLPLVHDTPKALGVRAFCNICTKCADACPVTALPFGTPQVGGANISALKGVRKWISDTEKCFGFWAQLASDCAICMRVCPFNRDFQCWYHRLWLRLALSPLRRAALWLDRKPGGAEETQRLVVRPLSFRVSSGAHCRASFPRQSGQLAARRTVCLHVGHPEPASTSRQAEHLL